MSYMIPWIGAEAERPEIPLDAGSPGRRRERNLDEELAEQDLRAHQFPAKVVQQAQPTADPIPDQQQPALEESSEQERERRIYRGRTVAMLRRYLRYSLETGRLPSLIGREFFRSKVTKYTVTTFEDRVIFVHDMETCLERLDEFSRQLIARHILQEHDQAATGKLLHCTERTVRNQIPIVLDLLADILLEVGLLQRIGPADDNVAREPQEFLSRGLR
jgi:hypothetical protein